MIVLIVTLRVVLKAVQEEEEEEAVVYAFEIIC